MNVLVNLMDSAKNAILQDTQSIPMVEDSQRRKKLLIPLKEDVVIIKIKSIVNLYQIVSKNVQSKRSNTVYVKYRI